MLIVSPKLLAEEMIANLTLSDVYSAIAYYLKNKDLVEEYLQQREELAAYVKQRLQSVQPDLSQIRSRILSQRNL